MSHQALYRKYRPGSFEDVVGQDHIISVLKNSIANKTIAHAYLFAGSRGLGKTSIARIFAKEIGTSENDTYEIDAASNRGIDDVRQLREGVQTLPFESPYKVYIIDEVHMLTKEAFNALLKTLEEPPAHAIFILATTEMHKLPATVISRCEVHHFKKPNQSILSTLVKNVAKKEGYSIDDAGANLIALLGDGSFRDTLGVLQKVLSSVEEKKVTSEDVSMSTGAPQNTILNGMVEAIADKNIEKSLSFLQEATSTHVNIKLFTTLLVERLRAVLLFRLAPEMLNDLKGKFNEDDFIFLEEVSKKNGGAITSQTLSRLLDVFGELSTSPVPELPLEIALIEIIESSK
jgi:DNA polymerase III subunit gamma/tau